MAGLPNRVYFQVRTTLGKPADLQGRCSKTANRSTSAVQTLTDDKEPGVNQGMGRFEFTPKAGSKYELQSTRPSASPSATTAGGAGRGRGAEVPEGVVAAGKPIRVTVRSSKPQRAAGRRVLPWPAARLGASGEGPDRSGAEAASGDGRRLPGHGVRGSRPPTRNRRDLKPVAERLIYRQPAEQLHVAVQPDQPAMSPARRPS